MSETTFVAMDDSDEDRLQLAQGPSARPTLRRAATKRKRIVVSDDGDDHDEEPCFKFVDAYRYCREDYAQWNVHDLLCRLRSLDSFGDGEAVQGLQIYSRTIKGQKQACRPCCAA